MIEPDSPAWFTLFTRCTSFHFKGQHGHFTACCGQQRKGSTHWYAYHQANRKLHKRYQGCVLWELRQYDEALQVAEQAIALDPAYVRAYSLQTTVLTYLGREDEAKQANARYLQLGGVDPH